MAVESPLSTKNNLDYLQPELKTHQQLLDSQLTEVEDNLDAYPASLSPIRAFQRWRWERQGKRLRYTTYHLEAALRELNDDRFRVAGDHLRKAGYYQRPGAGLLLVNTWSFGRLSPDAVTRLGQASRFSFAAVDLYQHQTNLDKTQAHSEA